MTTSFIQRTKTNRLKQNPILNILVTGLLVVSAIQVRAEVFVITPDASATVTSGTPMVIRWSDELETPLVNVELWDGVRGTTTVLARSIAVPQREISWIVPEDVESGDRYRFVVRDARKATRAIYSVGFTGLVRTAASPTGITEPTSQPFTVDVAPMPATDRIRVSWTEPVRRIEIVDLTGAVVIRLDPAPSSHACSVNITTLSSATYSVVAYAGSGNVTRRSLLVQR
jgi:hypothetical protein